jgi:deoxyribodipyrimidine photo-lyase
LKSYPIHKYFANFYKQVEQEIPSLQSIGFIPKRNPFPSRMLDEALIESYGKTRDYPAVPGTSKLGVHLRFGTISIRTLARKNKDLSAVFLNELIWRDFYHMILFHFPHVGKGKAFRPEYDAIEWRTDQGEFERWCNGQTGYPIVDAGMRELNATGFMHNRVRHGCCFVFMQAPLT